VLKKYLSFVSEEVGYLLSHLFVTAYQFVSVGIDWFGLLVGCWVSYLVSLFVLWEF
jgi:hypothetical protein